MTMRISSSADMDLSGDAFNNLGSQFMCSGDDGVLPDLPGKGSKRAGKGKGRGKPASASASEKVEPDVTPGGPAPILEA